LPEVDIFLIGVPKAGTTWLAHTLDQHHSIALSDPKEPNIIASHRGTFMRTNEEPNWNKFDTLFSEKGLRLDASVHAFACPLSPKRIKQKLPQAKFILCLREPVSRSFSHWNMIQNTKESVENGVDWSSFEKAWADNRLRDDSMYGKSMSRWLKEFNLNHFLIIDSAVLKTNPISILKKIEDFLGLESIEYNVNQNRHSNSAASRRPMTSFGKATRGLFTIIPNFVKKPIVEKLQKRDFNIYNLPLLSRKGLNHTLDSKHYNICGKELIEDLELFEKLTGFDTRNWSEKINNHMNND
tara:strand:+ start:7495 stop:8385 length:891 start_codon:yes stop_codon:yes gene_type:complete